MSGIMSMVLGAKTAIAAAVDAYFNLVTLLLPGDGTNGAQNNTFLDSSTNNFTITRNGNTTQGTFSPFSQTGWSNFFNGSSDYITVPQSTNLDLGSGNWTVEAWVYTTSNSGKRRIISKQNATNYWLLCLNASGSNSVVGFEIDTTTVITGTTAISSNTWAHIAIVRNSNTVTCYVNGAVDVSASYSGTPSAPNAVTAIGAYAGGPSEYFPGYISNVRYVKGSAVYTAAFTPSTTPLTAITNTSLLTCQSNRFIDNSSNAFAITVNGTPSVQAFSPFAPTAAYSAATNGGSGYFDGTGDYLSLTGGVTDNGTGDLTLEFWSYYTGSYSAEAVAFDSRVSPFTNGFAITSAATSGYWTMNFASQDILTSTAAAKNAWQHVVVTRSGNTFRLFVDGVLRGTVSSTNNMSNNTNKIGASYNNGSAWPGYLSGLRAIKGSIPTDYQTSSTTVGTSVFTPPTAPPTAVTNTSLLTNFTNAGITDATAKNDLETVGNAQISTTQSKFGGSSMYFDGTGDRLLAATSPLYDLGSGNWTVECWVYASNLSSMRGVFAKRGNADGEVRWINAAINTNGTIYTEIATSSSAWGIQASTTTAISATTWAHIAWVRNGSDVSVYVNGTKNTLSSSFTSSVYNGTEPFVLGANGTSGSTYFYQMNGYIDDFRITRGYARYTATFTPPTEAFALQ